MSLNKRITEIDFYWLKVWYVWTYIFRSNSLLFEVIGSLRNHNGDHNENIISKYEFTFNILIASWLFHRRV